MEILELIELLELLKLLELREFAVRLLTTLDKSNVIAEILAFLTATLDFSNKQTSFSLKLFQMCFLDWIHPM